MLARIAPPLKATSETTEFKFNSVSGLLAAAVWPFLPNDFRSKDYAMPAVIAWFSLGNIAIQFYIHRGLTWASVRQEEPANDPKSNRDQ